MNERKDWANPYRILTLTPEEEAHLQETINDIRNYTRPGPISPEEFQDGERGRCSVNRWFAVVSCFRELIRILDGTGIERKLKSLSKSIPEEFSQISGESGIDYDKLLNEEKKDKLSALISVLNRAIDIVEANK